MCARMDRCDWPMVATPGKDEWKSATTTNGELSVMMPLGSAKLKSSVNNWDGPIQVRFSPPLNRYNNKIKHFHTFQYDLNM